MKLVVNFVSYKLVQTWHVCDTYLVSLPTRMAHVRILMSVTDTTHVDMPATVLTQWAASRKTLLKNNKLSPGVTFTLVPCYFYVLFVHLKDCHSCCNNTIYDGV